MSWHDNDELPKMKTEHAQAYVTKTHFIAMCGVTREIGGAGPEITTFMASVNCRECLSKRYSPIASDQQHKEP